MQTKNFRVRSLLSNFSVSCDPKWQHLIRKWPQIAWLSSFSVISVASLRLVDVDGIGPWIFIDIALGSILGAVPLTYAVSMHFLVRQVADEAGLVTKDQTINWRPFELFLVTFALALAAAKLFRSVAA